MLRSFIADIIGGNTGLVYITSSLLADIHGRNPHASDFSPGSVTFVVDTKTGISSVLL